MRGEYSGFPSGTVIKIYGEHSCIILIKNGTISVSSSTLIKMFVYCAISVLLLETNEMFKNTL
jgi:hypothetical protein